MLAIQAPLAIPPTHPKDKSLLRPLSELGKPKFSTGGHSFLRRTEYISSEAKARAAEANANASKTPPKSPGAAKFRRPTDASREDPMNILRHIVKGFDLANPDDVYTGPDNESNFRGAASTPAETEAWKRPKHPTKPDVRLLNSYPVEPDLDSTTDSGYYIITKFSGNPIPSATTHDIRLDVGTIVPQEQGAEEIHEFYLPKDSDSARAVKRKYDGTDSAEDSGLNAHTNQAGTPAYRYQHHRSYEVGRQVMSVNHPYKEIALALHDSEAVNGSGRVMDRLDKGAYYYPIGTKLQLKPKRNKNLAHLGLSSQAPDESTSERADEIDIVIREPDDDEVDHRAEHRQELMPKELVANGN